MIKKHSNGIVSIDLLQVFRILWKNVLSIILVALMFAAASFAYTWFFVTPEYEAVASMYVNNSSFSFGSTSFSISSSEISASNSLVNSFIFLLESRETLETVIADTGIDYSVDELKEKIIKAEGITNTPAFTVSVKSTDPQEAEQIANSIAKILPQRISEIVDGATVRIVDHAIIPAHRASPSYTKVLVLFGLAGALAAAIWCICYNIITESQNETIGDASNVLTQYPQLQILATIPDMGIAEKKGYYYTSYYGSKKERQ